MGTSTSLKTPSGGEWTPLKGGITSILGGGSNYSPQNVVGQTVLAAGGLAVPALPGMPSGSTRGAARGRGSSSGGGGGGAGARGGSGGGRTTRSARAGGGSAVARTIVGLAAFGDAARTGGVAVGIEALGLADLSGMTPAEVVSRIAEHLADETSGLQHELLVNALRDALLDAASIQGDAGFQQLDEALQSFLQREGVSGLVTAFLTNYVFDRVWGIIEYHVDRKADSTSDAVALESAVQDVCRQHVRDAVGSAEEAGRFEQVDWFGREGVGIAESVVNDLEARLTALGRTE